MAHNYGYLPDAAVRDRTGQTERCSAASEAASNDATHPHRPMSSSRFASGTGPPPSSLHGV